MPPQRPKLRIKPSRTAVLPSEVHKWREKNWPLLQKIESRRGDALRIMKQVYAIGKITKQKIVDGKITPRKIRSAARAVQIFASEMTDELIKNAEELNMPHKTYNEEYWNCLVHLSNKIPDIVRHEIIFQMRFPNPTPEQIKDHERLISRLIREGHGVKKK